MGATLRLYTFYILRITVRFSVCCCTIAECDSIVREIVAEMELGK